MIAALITDYERAILDFIRTDENTRFVVQSLAVLPSTAEHEEPIQKLYRDEVRFKKITREAADRELERHREWQESFKLSYKAKGYKPPYEYGKGRVKVLFECIEGGKKA